MTQPTHVAAGSLHERLTGLPGVEAARARIAGWEAEGSQSGEPRHMHAMLVALQRFDAVNIAYGAAAGDGVLAEVASRVQHWARAELDSRWIAAHAGGGKFLIVAEGQSSRERWQLLADELADAIAHPVIAATGIVRLSPRVALLRARAGESLDSMLERLALALDKAMRQQGRRLVWSDGKASLPGRSAVEIEAELLGAIDRDEIAIVFQPQFSLPGERLCGAEALARWDHAELGRIGAGALFTIAERADHLPQLSSHVARRALEQARQWPGDLRLSLNVTPADLASGSYSTRMLDLLKQVGFPPRRLTLEVTEQALLQDIALAASTMADLSAQGIRIALDDFGAGFCNFRYLKVLPLHYLKLDRTMVEGIATDARDRAVLRGIVAMAHALDLVVIAEGIESEEQLAVVAEEGCGLFQGFLRATPMSGEEFLRLAGG
jgi:EAL domain-containing protein (putative c-di-GMP-specific phosphodiesterase class I)/GGDEF domain-containing protein